MTKRNQCRNTMTPLEIYPDTQVGALADLHIREESLSALLVALVFSDLLHFLVCFCAIFECLHCGDAKTLIDT